METWFDKPKYKNVKKIKEEGAVEIPKGTWTKCPSCDHQILSKLLNDSLFVCSKCGHHFRISSKKRIEYLIDTGTFEEHFAEIASGDPLNFRDAKESYKNKIQNTIKKSNLNEGVIAGTGEIYGVGVVIAVMDFSFMGGSMGSAVGEKIYQAMNLSIEKKNPLITVASSGGARMHEGILSLMQMAKTCVGIEKLEQKSIPYISILTDPTLGGVTASFASLGDVIIAEPKALIGFAGTRVIEQTIQQKLPEGFQSAEFLLNHGFIDLIVDRNNLKQILLKFLNFFNA